MKLIAHLFTAMIMLLTIAGVSQSAPLKTYVNEFTVSGAPGRDDLKTVLQGVLASRLNPEQVQLVESKDKAELTVAGSYARFGKIFSLDVQIKNMISNSLSRVFEQGEGEDDLLPAMGRLSMKVDRELAKIPAAILKAPVAPLPVSATPSIAAAAAATNPGYQLAPENIVKSAPAVAASQESYQIRNDEGAKSNPGSWTSPPVTGVFSSLALGRTLPGGEREIFISSERNIQYYHKGAELKLIAEAAIPNPAKILSIDTADLDKDGIPELYVTIYDRETLISRVYVPKAGGLELVAENLQWFFRGIGPDFKSRTVYAQEMASGAMATGAAELVKTGKSFSVKNQFKLPNSGFVYNFNKLGGAAGKGFFVVLDENGYLVVSTPTGEEAWKSSIKYGGSENHYKVELADQRRSLVGDYQWTFLEQRIVITPDGTLLVPHNEGLFNIGNSRSYTKYSMYALRWNGSSLQEKWHTRQNQSYLADFAYDAESKELILLEVVQKSDMFSKGKTVISINKVD